MSDKTSASVIFDSAPEYDLNSSSRSSSAVSFSTIEIRTHAMILGHSPSMTGGPSLQIDWNSQQRLVVDLDDYENSRPPRRLKQQLHMPSLVRENVLLSSGYSQKQIERAEKEFNKPAGLSRFQRITRKIISNTRSITRTKKYMV